MSKINWKKVTRTLGFETEHEMWEELYNNQQSSIEDLHERLGFGTHTIKRRLAVCNIALRGRGGNNHSTPPRKDILFHLDQRVVVFSTQKELSFLTGCSPAVISTYKTLSKGETAA